MYTFKFYGTLDEAGANLEGYLMAPPQLDESKGSIVRREVEFPIANSEFGKLIHIVAQVEFDEAALLRRYGMRDGGWRG